MENIASNKIESEIAELSQLIEHKKQQLVAQGGQHLEDRAIISEVVKEHLGVPQPVATGISTDGVGASVPVVPSHLTQNNPPDNYLDHLTPEDSTAVNSYISAIPDKGFKQTVEAIKVESPYLIDLFHDALVTKLFDELKSRGYIK